ncbi:hypothetical protein ARMSODRAFT_952611 [Armillaria solidipes]|uniref:Uncharacterized protein n=1 Tax=Armillaria solidipes TaxID=1076256 RepID=A0A2H3C5C6_9AGAR|nr:hypothetical protein ARMSODRAFT_952611 [Armillaria solidipes]
MRTTIGSFVTFNPRHCQHCTGKINIYVSLTMHRSRAPNFTLSELREVGVPEYFFSTIVFPGSSEQSLSRTCYRIRRI